MIFLLLLFLSFITKITIIVLSYTFIKPHGNEQGKEREESEWCNFI